MIDKVISSVVTVIVVLLAALFVYVSVFANQGEATRARQTYEQEYGELLIDSIFLSYENGSGMTYESLLAKSLQDVATVIEVNGVDINVSERFADVFDELLGEGNYYFSVDPLLAGVTVSYVLDGSSTMLAKRQAVNDELPALIAELNDILGEDASVFTHLYILNPPGDALKCGEFTVLNQERITCEDLRGEELYHGLMLRGFEPPAPEPYRFYNEWVFGTHAATAGHFSQSDWAAGLAYASYAYQENTLERTLTNQHVIVTVVDELTTSSKADECFQLTDSTDTFVCFMCNDECPAIRSERIVNQTRDLLVENDDLVIGFQSFPCDYQYDTRNDNLTLSPNTCKYLDRANACSQVKDPEDPGTPPDWVNPPANANWCEQDNCGGCTPAPAGDYCFHSNCNQLIIDHLTEIASATRGEVHDLEDLSQLTGAVSEYLDGKVDAFNMTIGVRNETRDRYAIEKPLTLSNGERIGLRFWIYE